MASSRSGGTSLSDTGQAPSTQTAWSWDARAMHVSQPRHPKFHRLHARQLALRRWLRNPAMVGASQPAALVRASRLVAAATARPSGPPLLPKPPAPEAGRRTAAAAASAVHGASALAPASQPEICKVSCGSRRCTSGTPKSSLTVHGTAQTPARQNKRKPTNPIETESNAPKP